MSKECCVVIGSSKGLGAALVNELIASHYRLVIGVARTEFDELPAYESLRKSKKYFHVVADVTSDNCLDKLINLYGKFLGDSLTVIFNAAKRTPDVDKENNINFDEISNTNKVGIFGLINVIKAFEKYWLANNGKLIGISSINAIYPPILEHRISYGATKTYMDMLLRNLSILWNDRVNITTIHLGHIGGGYDHNILPKYLQGSYTKAAKKIMKIITKTKPPVEVTWPAFYKVYKYLAPFLPDLIFYKLVRRIIKLIG